jgi:MFS family permease
MTYVIEFAEKQLKTEPEQSGFLLTAMFVTATVSCVLVGVIAQRVHRNMFILQLIFAVGGVSSLLFPFYDSYAYLVVYMIVQGVAYSHRTLLPVIPLTEGMVSIRDNAETLALISMSQALGLFAVPIAGWMYDGMGSYTPGFVLSGCLACIVSGLLFVDVFLGRRGSDRRSTKHIDCETGVTSKASEYGVMNVVYFESYV